MSISAPKRGLLFITLFDIYLMVCIGNIQFCKLVSSAKPIKRFAGKRKWISIFNSKII